MAKGKVVLGMSGGVDSSVAVHLLQQAGYEVLGVHMQLIPERYQPESAAAVDDARRVAERFGIPFYVLDERTAFEAEVIDHFIGEYAAGRTPNPCILCNRAVKFRLLAQFADQLQADGVATGHYARLLRDEAGEAYLAKGADTVKDQSYFLFNIERALLPRLILPLGQYKKDEIRAIAARLGLTVADKPDSQEVCFIPDNDYKRFLLAATGRSAFPSGDFVDAGGQRLGTHQGIACYTIGQRKGLGLALGYPAYVTALDAVGNRVTVGTQDELYHDGLLARGLNLHTALPEGQPIAVTAKIRYRAQAEPALLTLACDEAQVRFARPQRAITPGQGVCFYDGDRVLGGGMIAQVLG